MLLLVDNGSVFTPHVDQCLRSTGADFVKLRVEDVRPADAGRYGPFILSGRRRNHRVTNATNARIVRHCASAGIPLLGICYGAEIMALALGGAIRRMDAPRQGPHRIRVTRRNPLSSGSIMAYESHSYEIARLGPDITPVAGSEACRHEIVMHANGRMFGTQFHPEMTTDGRSIIEKFVNTFNK